MGPGDLTRALNGLTVHGDPRLIVGHETFDDAGVFVLAPDLALVQTVDFFAPIVDDPYRFGQIAAANALSDVYAMGGTPLTAMNVVGFPSGKLPLEVLGDILRGGHDVVHEAGAVLVGGHTVIDEEVKYGLSVTGRVHPDRVLSNRNAREGERLVLTKPIGTGVLATAMKRGLLGAEAAESLYSSMRRLNADASAVAVELGVRCATDVTGFGLLGHARHIAAASAVTLVIESERVPLLPSAREFCESGVSPGGADRNRAFIEDEVDWSAVAPIMRTLMVDPQTSGGLLLTIPEAQVDTYLSRVAGSVDIGRVVAAGTRRLVVV